MSDKSLEYFTRLASTLSFAKIDTASSGDNTIVTGVSGQKIIVYSVAVIVGTANNIIWKSGSTTIMGSCELAANGGYHFESMLGIMEAASGDNLIINLSAAVQTGGGVTYAQISA